jgi:hypothetical protein
MDRKAERADIGLTDERYADAAEPGVLRDDELITSLLPTCFAGMKMGHILVTHMHQTPREYTRVLAGATGAIDDNLGLHRWKHLNLP